MKGQKRTFALFLAAALLFGLCGCGMFSTRMARAVQKMSKLESLRFELDASLELALTEEPWKDETAEEEGEEEEESDSPLEEEEESGSPIESEKRSLPIRGGFAGSGALYTDPLRLELETLLSLPGLESRQIIYGEKEESAYYFYSRANEGSIWQKQGLAEWSGGKVNGLKYLVEAAAFFEEAGVETVGGREAQRYDGVFPGDFLAGLFALYHVRDFLCDGLGLQLAEGVLEEPEAIPASIWLDMKSGMILRLDADLGDFARRFAERQLQQTREALGLESLGLGLELEELHVSLRLSDFDAAGDFQIPDEAKSAWGDSVKPWEK